MTAAQANNERKPTRRPSAAAGARKPRRAKAGKPSHRTAVDESGIGADRWHEMVATAAYYRAESRGFEGGSPEDDWYEAEAELREQFSRAGNPPQAGETAEGEETDIEHSGG